MESYFPRQSIAYRAIKLCVVASPFQSGDRPTLLSTVICRSSPDRYIYHDRC